MFRSTPWAIFSRLVQLPVLLLGALFGTFALHSQVELLPTFILPKYKDFWDDVTAYRLRTSNAKTLDQLYEQYGSWNVHEFVVEQSMKPGFVPSEKSTQLLWLGASVTHTKEGSHKNQDWLYFAVGAFPFVLFPSSVFLAALTRNFAWALCRSRHSRELFAEHYDTLPWQWILGWLLAMPVVVALAGLSAYLGMTPELRERGFTLFDLTFISVFQSYMGGLGLRFVRGTIDAVFISRGINPERTVWDDLLTIALTAPVLVFVLDNPAVSILADLAAGLGPPFVVKVLQRLRGRHVGPLEAEAAADGDGAIARNLWLALAVAVVGIVVTCGGCCVTTTFGIAGGSPELTRKTVADIEQTEKPDRMHTLELTDGYLFWPALGGSAGKSYGVGGHWEEAYIDYYFVPLVSKPVLDEWLEQYRKDPKAKYALPTGRVIVRFRPAELEHLFPQAAWGNFDPRMPYAPATIRGAFTSHLSDNHREAIARHTRPADFETARILVNDQRGGLPITMPIAFVLMGLPAWLPLPLRLLHTRLKPVDEAIPVVAVPDPTPTVEPAD